MLCQAGEERGGGIGGGVELQSREHWAVSAGQLTDFEILLGVCFEESLLRTDGGAAAEELVVEVQGWEAGGGEGGT